MAPWLLPWLVGCALGDEGVEEVVVTAERRLRAAQEAVHQALRARKYRRVLRLGQRSWYIHAKVWKPGVMVHDQGFSRIRGRAVLPVGVRRNAHQPEVIEAVFLTQSRGTRRQQKAALAASLEPHLREIRDARWRMAQPDREARLKAELAALWFDGVDLQGAPLPDRRAIRAALLDRWLATASGEPGEWARQVIEAFLEREVQPSDHPVTAGERRALAGEAPADRDPLTLSEPPPR